MVIQHHHDDNMFFKPSEEPCFENIMEDAGFGFSHHDASQHPFFRTSHDAHTITWTSTSTLDEQALAAGGLVDPQSIFGAPRYSLDHSSFSQSQEEGFDEDGHYEEDSGYHQVCYTKDDISDADQVEAMMQCDRDKISETDDDDYCDNDGDDSDYEEHFASSQSTPTTEASARFWPEKECLSPTFVAGPVHVKGEPESELGSIDGEYSSDPEVRGPEDEKAAIILMGLAKESQACSEPDTVKAEAKDASSSKSPEIRVFPDNIHVHPDFSRFYQRYKVPSSLDVDHLYSILGGTTKSDFYDDVKDIGVRAVVKHGAYNPPRDLLDLYTPRYCRGSGISKEGMCPICYEDDKVRFFKTKISAYNYHLQYCHGISAGTGLPFAPPIKYRTRSRAAGIRDKSELLQGLCHVCSKYIDVEGTKLGTVKVPEIYWWKHAQACHRSAKPMEKLSGYFVEDAFYKRVTEFMESTDN